MKLTNLSLFLLSYILSSALVAGAEIRVGMDFAAAKELLNQHKLEVGDEHQLSVATMSKLNRMEFCKLDSNTTLILNVEQSANRIVSMSAYFIPDNSTSKDQRLTFNVSKLKLLKDAGLKLTLEFATPNQTVEETGAASCDD